MAASSEEYKNIDLVGRMATGSEVNSVQFTWTLHHFTKFNRFKSYSFYTGGAKNAKWQLRFAQNSPGAPEYAFFYLDLKSDDEVRISFDIFVLDAENKKSFTVQSERNIKMSPIENCFEVKFYKKYFLLHNDCLKILIELVAPEMDNSKTKVLNLTSSSLFDDFQSLLLNGKFSDVKLIVQDKEIQAHKAVLAARSPVFAAMFESNMEEKLTNVIKIDDMNADTMNLLLYFIYYAKYPKPEYASLINVFIAADKYGIEDLKHYCEYYLVEGLTAQNALEILYFSDIHSAASLKFSVMNYINTHKSSVKAAHDWKDFFTKRPHLLFDLYDSQ